MQVKWFIRGVINPHDFLTTFFKLMTTSMVLRFTHPNFIKMQDKLIMKFQIAIRVKKVVANIIKKDIIPSAKHSFNQAIKDPMIVW